MDLSGAPLGTDPQHEKLCAGWAELPGASLGCLRGCQPRPCFSGETDSQDAEPDAAGTVSTQPQRTPRVVE